MRKDFHHLIAAALTLALLLSSAAALAQNKYVSIKEIRDTVPERWTGEYTDKKGNTISIDTPIVVPKVDTVPIVRITWGGPYDNVNESLIIKEDSQLALDIWYNLDTDAINAPYAGRDTSVSDTLTLEDAPTKFITRLQSLIPALNDETFDCYFAAAYGSNSHDGIYRVCFYSSYHDIPYLVGTIYQTTVDSELADNMLSVPRNNTYGWIKSENQLCAIVSAPQEIGIDIEDIPLLPFDEIQKVLEGRVAEGYVYSLNEVRFGYMAFIDSQNVGKEFVLCPVWAAKGITRGDVNFPFTPDEDPVGLDGAGYCNSSICVVNAQTGETYDFYYDTRDERRYVPSILSWDEVK